MSDNLKYRKVSIMRWTWVLILILQAIACKAVAQNLEDDISIEIAESNNTVLMYGEPVYINFYLHNHGSSAKNYYSISTGVNLFFELYEKNSGLLIGKTYSAGRPAQTLGPNILLEGYGSKYFSFNLLSVISHRLRKYTEGLKAHSSFSDELYMLPERDYELLIKINLEPGDIQLTKHYEFSVMFLPGDEPDAHQKYLDATVYAVNNYYYALNAYDPSSPDSYESFIDEYPNSIFVDYAKLNLAKYVYYYPIPATLLERKREFYTQYLRSEVRNPNVVGEFASSASSFINKLDRDDRAKAYDLVLQNLAHREPELSKMVIRMAEEFHQIVDLKDYSRNQEE